MAGINMKNKWKRTESPEMHPQLCGQLIFNRDVKVNLCKTIVFNK